MKEKNLILIRRIICIILTILIFSLALKISNYYTVGRVIFIFLLTVFFIFGNEEVFIRNQYVRIVFLIGGFVFSYSIAYVIQWASAAVGAFFMLFGWLLKNQLIAKIFWFTVFILVGYIVYLLVLKYKKK